jgi:signal peptidase II
VKPGVSRISAAAAVVYVVDQATKWAIRRSLELGQHKDILPFFSIDHVENTGAAFGVMIGQNLFFILSSVAVLAFLAYYSRHLPDKWTSWLGQGFVWGGALGNLTDRLLYGHVTDFLDFFAGEHHWPSFNVADSAITAGAALLFLSTLF